MIQATIPLPHSDDSIDPLPPGRIAMWLLLASDLMFFLGLVGAFLVLRTGNAQLFADHRTALSKGIADGGVLALVLSSVAMLLAAKAAQKQSAGKSVGALVLTLLCGGGFVASRLIEYSAALNHHTIVARQTGSDSLNLFDGRIKVVSGQQTLLGYAAPLPEDFEIHTISQNEVARLSPQGSGNEQELKLPAEIFQDIRYGPGKNVFYAIWYTLTAAHLIHLLVGMVAVALLILQVIRKRAVPRAVEYVALYWHFIVLLGIAMIPLFYLRP